MSVGEHKYSYLRNLRERNALRFSGRSSFVREIMLERVFPTKIILPMKQHFGDECVPIVTIGEHVLIGQCIGIPPEGAFAVPIHAGISGTVTDIKPIRMPNGVECKAVCIESDRKRTRHPSVVLPRMELNISASTVMGIVRDSGIVGLGGEGIPTIAKIDRARKAGVRELLVNILQSEPYAVCDLFIAGEYADYVLMGAVAVAGACGTHNITVLISADKKDEIEALRAASERVTDEYPDFTIGFKFFRDRFPQGYYRLVARALYGKELAEDDTLEDSCGAVLFNCSTLYACWDAISGNMPLTGRLITISDGEGGGHNVLAPIGTPVSELLNTVNGISETESRVVWGGCMTGLLVTDPDNTPIIKTTTAITVVRKREIVVTKCIHCGKCAENCPMDINPGLIAKLVSRGAFSKADEERAGACIACGTCSYVCPSGLDLTGTVAGYAVSAQKKKQTTEGIERRSIKTNGSIPSTEKIVIGSVSMLESYSEDESAGDEGDEEKIFLPFEGGKEV